MRFLKALGRWLGTSIVVIAIALIGIRPFLLCLLLPFRYVVLLLALAGACWSGWRLVRGKERLGRVSRIALMASVILGLGCALWTYQSQFSAYREQLLSFDSNGAKLVGTLYLPKSGGPFPGMVLVHGSGKFPRHLYHVWADHFVRRGFAVLIYDKRGVGPSGGEYESENNTSRKNIEILSNDAANALTALATRPEVDPPHVGFWGISQAGWIVPRAAMINPRCTFMLLLSAPTTTVGEENDYSNITGDHAHSDGLTVEKAEEMAARIPAHGFDPLPDLQSLAIPGFWLQGDRDWSIPVQRSLKILDQLGHENKSYSYRVFHNAGHAVVITNGVLVPRLPDGYWESMDQWLDAVASRERK